MSRLGRTLLPTTLGGILASCAGPTTSAPEPPTYALLARQVFSNCTTRSCHGPEGRKGGLQLTTDVAYEQLVGVPASHPAAAAKGRMRVVAGDPTASWLLDKLEGPAPDEGGPMPPRGDRLPEADRALVRAWIAAGCPR